MFYFILMTLLPSINLHFALEIPSHMKMEGALRQAWNKRYPYPFKKILKSDLAGKGVLVYQTEKGRAYIYSYLIYVPHITLEGEKVKEKTSGREIPVRLYFIPEADNEFEVKIGIFVEKSDKRKMIGWVKGQ